MRPDPIAVSPAGLALMRERAARALCRHAGNPEATMFEGRPMWESYLAEADYVLKAIGVVEGQP